MLRIRLSVLPRYSLLEFKALAKNEVGPYLFPGLGSYYGPLMRLYGFLGNMAGI